MPELPEVEVIAQGLDVSLRDHIIQSVELLWPRAVAIPEPAAFVERAIGRRFTQVWRRGKYLVFNLDDGQYLLAHLRMTGSFCFLPREEPLDPYVRAIFQLDGAYDLRFADIRKFGQLYLVDRLEDVLGGLGPEPLDAHFSSEQFAAMLRRRHARIKPLLLDQTFLAGMGNIYTDEALFQAGIHPLRCSDSLSEAESRRLHAAIQAVLRDAIARRGTTLDTYRDAEGKQGNNQYYLNVYGRKDAPCPRCGRPIQRIVIGQRGTYFCAHCQV